MPPADAASSGQADIEHQKSKITEQGRGGGERVVKLTVAYDGTDFAGWQSQSAGRTVQQTLEAALQKLTGESMRVVASGRTDAGVHAAGQVVSFRTASTHPATVFVKALNSTLPDDLVVLAAEDAPPTFHALRSARRKRYRYTLHDGPTADIFRRRYCWWVRQPLDDAAMQRAAQPLVGRHDFSSFESSGSPRATSVRNVYELSVVRQPPPDDHLIQIEVEADGFLYNMVRSIVGTLIDVGRGANDEAWPAHVLAACDRRIAGRTAPPQGLCLLWVKYEGRDEG